MAEPMKEFKVHDLVSLVAETIKERLALLGEIQKTEAQTGQINKQAALERRELLRIALREIEMWVKWQESGGGESSFDKITT